ncbi:protein kinase domain-containing protein [Hyalangium sp.]|uniref:protein kinase domain-containing protein n=1 Tax=Hyalangium sp. TaxID=2028555 RepID=UPI002D754452|nr:protein kinase [Hyalangium sp.]HYH97305.1 protein kinase [Hyalangium sp.]
MTDLSTADSLRPGFLVGPWRIEAYAGHGTYGAVYRARRAGHPGSMPVALKMAVFPYDPRFVREEKLLSRLHHPSLPQLLDRGWWHAGPEAMHPYLVMEWVRGKPLYDWAREHNPTTRQVLKGVAQIAWALEVVHRADCLHRDVKGDNILVEPEGRAVLTDFGSGTWRGAPPLTDRVMPPNTRPYRSPEALRFEWGNWRKKEARYEARPADDLYALGVTLYRLVTGEYPPPGTDPEKRQERLQSPVPKRVPAQELNGRVLPELAALIERLLAEQPEARGVGREIAEAAESAAEHLGAEADVRLLGSERPAAVAMPGRVVSMGDPEPPVAEAVAVPVRTRAEDPSPPWALRSMLVAAKWGLAVVGTWGMAHVSHGGGPERTQAEASDAGVALDGGTRGLGDGVRTALAASEEGAPVASEGQVIAKELPDKPLPGQRRPPCRGSGLFEINGGCWRRFQDASPPCEEEDYEWRGACYSPFMVRAQPRTSKKQR